MIALMCQRPTFDDSETLVGRVAKKKQLADSR